MKICIFTVYDKTMYNAYPQASTHTKILERFFKAQAREDACMCSIPETIDDGEHPDRLW